MYKTACKVKPLSVPAEQSWLILLKPNNPIRTLICGWEVIPAAANAVAKQVEQVPTSCVTCGVGSFVGVSVGCSPNEAFAFMLWSLNPFASLFLPAIC
jgi:hypothetical protein